MQHIVKEVKGKMFNIENRRHTGSRLVMGAAIIPPPYHSLVI